LYLVSRYRLDMSHRLAYYELG